MSNAVMNKKELSKKDLVKAWALVYSSETCYNYERLQALGNTNMMMSVVKKLYDTKEEQVEALKTYMEFFNTEPSWIGTVIHGITVSMEEQKANGADISGEDINALRTGLMGPMAGIGDTVSQAVVYPILAGICCSLALDGNFAGPILFEVVYKVLMIGCGYTCFMLGYKQGKQAIFKLLQSGTLNKITEAFSIIGLTVVGNMAYSRINVICTAKFRVGEVKIVVQDIFNQLLPGAIPLIIALFVWWMVKKKMNPTLIIAVIFVIGIAASLLGLLSVAA